MSLKRKSFENLARFWEAELRQLSRGVRPEEIFTASLRKTLVKHEILLPRRGRGLRLEVNPRALQILRRRKT